MTQDEEIRRGHEAERVLSEPLLVEAFSRVEAAIVDALKRCPVGDRNTQHELCVSLQLLGKVHGHIKEAATTGKLARIAKEQSVASRVADFVRRRA